MTQLVFGHDAVLAAWAAQRIEHGVDFPDGCVAIGFMGDVLDAVAVYYDHDKRLGTCNLSVAVANPRIVTRGNLRVVLSVPFLQYGVRKLKCSASSRNLRVHKFLLGIGFIRDATMRHELGHKHHLNWYSMMDTEFQKKYLA